MLITRHHGHPPHWSLSWLASGLRQQGVVCVFGKGTEFLISVLCWHWHLPSSLYSSQLWILTGHCSITVVFYTSGIKFRRIAFSCRLRIAKSLTCASPWECQLLSLVNRVRWVELWQQDIVNIWLYALLSSVRHRKKEMNQHCSELVCSLHVVYNILLTMTDSCNAESWLHGWCPAVTQCLMVFQTVRRVLASLMSEWVGCTAVLFVSRVLRQSDTDSHPTDCRAR